MAGVTLSRRALLAVFFVLFAVHPSLGADLKPSQYCFDGCNAALDLITFTSAPGALKDYYDAKCSNLLEIKSLFYCGYLYCSPSEVEAGISYENGICKTYAASDVQLPSFESIIGSMTKGDLDQVVRIDASNLSTDPYDYPVVPSAQFFKQGFDTTAAFANNKAYGWDFSWAMYGFWGFVLSIGIINRMVELWLHRSSSNDDYDASKHHATPSMSGKLHLWFRRRLLLPATFGRRCQEPTGWCTLPPRLESLILALFLIMNIVFCFPGYHLFLGNLYYAAPKLQLARYVSDRTGVLAMANIPLLWVFGARNDPFLWLTGWSFATYNRFHRWVARIATAEAIAHSIGYSVFSYYVGGDDFKVAWASQYWYCGGIATIVMSLMLGASAYPLRQHCYDLFLLVHKAFAVIFLVTMYYHVLIFKGQYNGFIWPCVAMWSIDRILRYGRIIIISVLPRLKGIKALVTYDPQADLLRLDVTDFFVGKPPRPGTFYYVYEGAAIRGYENHPFTLCTWKESDRSSASSPIKSSLDDTMLDRKNAGNIVVSDASRSTESRHSFLIRPYAGFTGRLRDKIIASKEANSSQITVLLEGPYGESINLHRHSDALIVAGGSGITAAISQSYALLSTTKTTAVRIVWAVRQIELVDEVCANELKAALESGRVSLDVFLTSIQTLNNDAIVPSARYTIHTGRPDIEAEIARSRGSSVGSLGVVCCGLPKMADACRAAVVHALGLPGVDVGFYNETSGW